MIELMGASTGASTPSGRVERLGLQPGADDLPGEEDVRTPLEVDPDDADPVGGSRADPANSQRPVQGGSIGKVIAVSTSSGASP